MGLIWAGAVALALAGATGGDSSEERTELNAVQVTAGGRSAPLGLTPISVTAFDSRTIEARRLKAIDDLTLKTPGLSFTRTAFGATTQISLRGVSSRVGTSTVGLYLDDAPIQVRNLGVSAANPFPALFDLQRVEVLKGPQGTLYGAGAEGGAIRFITPDADLRQASGRLKLEGAATHGGAGSYEAGASAGAPLATGKAAVRLTLWTRRDGGYIDRVDRTTGRLIDRDSNRLDSRLARLALAFALTPRLTLSPKLEFQDQRLKDSNAWWEAFSDPGDSRFAGAFNTPEPDRDRWLLASTRLVYEGDGVRLTSASAYFQRIDRSVIDYSTYIPASFGTPVVRGLPGYRAYSEMQNKQTAVSQELRAQSTRPDARFGWLVGAYLGSARQRAIQALNDPEADALARAAFGLSFARLTGQGLIDGRYSFLLDDVGHDRQQAVFGELEARLTPALSLTGGLRVSRTEFEYRGRQSGSYAGGVTGGQGVKRERPATPKLALSWRPEPETLVYLSAAEGYRIGGVNSGVPAVRCAADLAALGLASTPTAYASDRAWSYEAGLKTTLADGRLALQSSVYRIDWSDIQQSVSLPGCGYLYNDNLGRARSQGFDLVLQAQPLAGLSVSASLAHVDARYRETVLGGFTGPGRRAVIVAKGDRLNARPWTLSASAEYRFRVGRSGAPAYVRADYEALSRQASPTPVNDPAAFAYDPGLPPAGQAHRLSTRVGARWGRVDVSLYADNLLDRAPRLIRQHDSRTSPFYGAVTFRPRTVGLSADYAF